MFKPHTRLEKELRKKTLEETQVKFEKKQGLQSIKRKAIQKIKSKNLI